MSIWYPGSGLTYGQYLQANSFVRDVTGQIKTTGKALQAKVSNQTLQLVASNRELSHQFKSGFDSMNNTLEWGFDRIEYILQDVNASIDSLHADFNYGMGLLLEQIQIQNNLLLTLIDKLDAIHKTLQSPTLTQAREFYHIGCERLTKGLLDKALEAFLESEKKNDTDFFTQFLIGKLYLYGIDDDDNVVDLEKAKQHLLLAARYAKAEISTDASFSKLAAESLLHTSIAIYAQLGEKGVTKTTELLQEAALLTAEATKLYPNFIEAYYHLSKYYALLNESTTSMDNLEKAVIADRNYAIKVDIDHAFDLVRSSVIELLNKLKEQKMNENKTKIHQAEQYLKELENWRIEDSKSLSRQFIECKQNLSKAIEFHENQTYFGYLDSIPLAENTITLTQKLKSKRIEELKIEINKIIEVAQNNFPKSGIYSKQVDEKIIEYNKLKTKVISHLETISYNSFMKALPIAKDAKLKAEFIKDMANKEENERIRKEKEQRERRYLQEKEEKEKRELINELKSNLKGYTKVGLIIGAIAGFIGGCANCINDFDAMLNHGKTGVADLATTIFFGGLVGGAFLGLLCALLVYSIKSSTR